jgi:hypothetical protein
MRRIVFIGKKMQTSLITGYLKRSIYKTVKYQYIRNVLKYLIVATVLFLFDNGLPETISPKHKSFGELKVFSVMRDLITDTGIPSHEVNFTE